MIPRVGGAAADVDALGKLAGKGLRCDTLAMYKVVLLK